MKTQAKLSSSMLDVLRLMYSGWELARSGGGNVRFWVQKGGAGCGGESKNVNAATHFALWQRGMITENKLKYPTSTYKLTPAGKRAVKKVEATQ